MLEQIGLDLFGFGAKISSKTWSLQRTYNWQLFLPHFMGGIPGLFVSQFCQGVRFAGYNDSPEKQRYGAEQRGMVGERTIGDVSLLFVSPADMTVYNYFTNWSNLKVDKQGFYHTKSEYKRDIFIVLYDTTGIETNRYKLHGCFPINQFGFEGTYGEENVQWLNFQLNVDSVTPGSLISRIGSLARVGINLSKLF